MNSIENKLLVILKDNWELEGQLIKLAGFEDINFKLKNGSESYLIKLSIGEYTADLDLQLQALIYANQNADEHGIFLSSIIKSIQGNTYEHITLDGENYCLRVHKWLEGYLYANTFPKSRALLIDLGKKTGAHVKLLRGFSHPAAIRDNFKWDLNQANWIKPNISLTEPEIKVLITEFMHRYESLLGQYGQLEKGVIHNDLNDYNIITAQGKVKGFIDYGDLCFSQYVNELAILIAYAVMDMEDPLEGARWLVHGFHSTHPLSSVEISLIHTLVGMRLSVSLVTSAINKSENPDNEYLQISERPAKTLIRKWANIHPNLANYHFRAACNYEPCTRNKDFLEWLGQNQAFYTQVVDGESEDFLVLDLGVGSKELGHEDEFNNPWLHHAKVTALRKASGKKFAIGKYDEVRPLYSSDDFYGTGNNGRKWRTVHIGLDFFSEAHSEVYAFADGIVHSLKYNEGDKNYGNTVILRHQFNGVEFFSLYGHLSSKSLEKTEVGQSIKKGDLIAWFGEPHENGNWAPHLHFQLILDMMNWEDDFPGVAYFNERNIYTSISPNPAPCFGIKWENIITDKSKVLEKRKALLGRSYSLSYDQPLLVERAAGSYLYDETGRKYLDCVNNVAHVGHQNKEVIGAATLQMALLNTNTRYLHPGIIRLSDKLLNLLPDHLKVCHFVNSGSEANELAMRMARIKSGKEDIIVMEHGYHGNTNICVAISSYKFDGKGGEGKPEYVHLIPMPDPVRGDKSKYGIELAEEAIHSLGSKLDECGTFIHESILSCGGQVTLPHGFLETLYQEFSQRGIVCIADEVQTGLGRVGEAWWAFELHDIEPDIVTIGKPLGNGHPVGAVVCREEIADCFANGMEYFNTFGGNPVSCAVAESVIDYTIKKDLKSHALELGRYIQHKLITLQKKYLRIADVRGNGFFLGWEFTKGESGTPDADTAAYVVNRMKDLGILLSTDGPFHNVIKFKPPMVFSKDNADYMLWGLEKVLTELQNQ